MTRLIQTLRQNQLTLTKTASYYVMNESEIKVVSVAR